MKVAPPAATTTQIDRIRAALAKDIEAGGLTVGTKGDFIVVEINNLPAVRSPARPTLKAEFQPIAADIAAALDNEPGPIRIVGHTDNVKPREIEPVQVQLRPVRRPREGGRDDDGAEVQRSDRD